MTIVIVVFFVITATGWGMRRWAFAFLPVRLISLELVSIACGWLLIFTIARFDQYGFLAAPAAAGCLAAALMARVLTKRYWAAVKAENAGKAGVRTVPGTVIPTGSDER
ncbi:hypothetical protein [Paraburkholderia sp. J63]|uniref:hypothetical protein n=1 Tax=Paraburkholderia sp. J63 TaxID=2805434 RepID=UPI002ABDA873|nr:hypothetical protein [Paraburkholderia sp. J63]